MNCKFINVTRMLLLAVIVTSCTKRGRDHCVEIDLDLSLNPLMMKVGTHNLFDITRTSVTLENTRFSENFTIDPRSFDVQGLLTETDSIIDAVSYFERTEAPESPEGLLLFLYTQVEPVYCNFIFSLSDEDDSYSIIFNDDFFNDDFFLKKGAHFFIYLINEGEKTIKISYLGDACDMPKPLQIGP